MTTFVDTKLGKISLIKETAEQDKYFQKYFVDGYLHLGYPEGHEDIIEECFEDCNEKLGIYEKTTKLFICSDFFFSLHHFGRKFIHVKHMEISGSRFWDLSLDQFPPFVEEIIALSFSNTYADRFFEGVNTLKNLRTLTIDLDIFDRGHDLTSVFCEFENPADNAPPKEALKVCPKLDYIKIVKCTTFELDDFFGEPDYRRISTLFPYNKMDINFEIKEGLVNFILHILN